MRAFLIPHASPHNSHANRISRPRREVERAVQKEQRDYYRHGRPTFAHNAARALVLLGGCFANCGRKFATIKYSTRTSPPASYYFAKCEHTARRECLRAIARKISRRAVVIAYSRSPRKYRRAAVYAHISFLFHLSQTCFPFFSPPFFCLFHQPRNGPTCFSSLVISKQICTYV